MARFKVGDIVVLKYDRFPAVVKKFKVLHKILSFTTYNLGDEERRLHYYNKEVGKADWGYEGHFELATREDLRELTSLQRLFL